MKNSKVIISTFIIILGMIIVPTVYKIYKNHEENLIKVVEKEFLYYAKNCYNESVCKEPIVELKDLYENDYLKEKLTNPINKKYYSEKSSINLDTNEIKLIS
ncbi:MAG: hypothetical protein HFI36_02470 [Bacilli bacterium]|nr:hypothetical protein [Bacilli bacterium]MCX4254992.1 hypothetical protein [Bacilli bacterium]